MFEPVLALGFRQAGREKCEGGVNGFFTGRDTEIKTPIRGFYAAYCFGTLNRRFALQVPIEYRDAKNKLGQFRFGQYFFGEVGSNRHFLFGNQKPKVENESFSTFGFH